MRKQRPSKPSVDIRPLSEVRAQIAAVIEHVQDTRRPVFLTQRGRSAAVLLDVGAYEEILDELELLRDVRAAEDEIANGLGVPHARARAAIRARVGATTAQPRARPGRRAS